MAEMVTFPICPCVCKFRQLFLFVYFLLECISSVRTKNVLQKCYEISVACYWNISFILNRIDDDFQNILFTLNHLKDW